MCGQWKLPCYSTFNKCFSKSGEAHFISRWEPYLDFMPGLISTFLSELATTRTNTSPASGWFCLFKYLFTLSSMYVPNLVDCNPLQRPAQTQKQNAFNINSRYKHWDFCDQIKRNIKIEWSVMVVLLLNATHFWLKTCSPFLFCQTSSDSCHR